MVNMLAVLQVILSSANAAAAMVAVGIVRLLDQSR